MKFEYDRECDPPAPVIRARLGRPEGGAGVLVEGLLDSGADVTVVPAELATRLRLPPAGSSVLTGVDGHPWRAVDYSVRVEVAGGSEILRAAAFGGLVIFGRDLLNRARVLLDGPKLATELSWPKNGPGRGRGRSR